MKQTVFLSLRKGGCVEPSKSDHRNSEKQYYLQLIQYGDSNLLNADDLVTVLSQTQ